MKVVLLAGGFGTRLSEYTDIVPKPMVTVGGKPLLLHIMNTFSEHGHKDFYIALGYKAQVIKEYFLNYHSVNSDFSVNLGTGKVQNFSTEIKDWDVTLIDTGLHSMTGGRVKRLQSFIGNEPFLLTYGDGVADIDVNKLIDFHKSHGKMVTVTGVHPSARFGELSIEGTNVKAFKEKPQTGQGWINGGYFVCQPDFFDLIEGDNTVLEQSPLETVAAMGQLETYLHKGFWQCMDTKRDRDNLEKLWNNDKAPWKV